MPTVTKNAKTGRGSRPTITELQDQLIIRNQELIQLLLQQDKLQALPSIGLYETYQKETKETMVNFLLESLISRVQSDYLADEGLKEYANLVQLQYFEWKQAPTEL